MNRGPIQPASAAAPNPPGAVPLTPDILPISAVAPKVAGAALLTPDTAAVWNALAAVPDPEVPVVSVVELGLIRQVEWREGELIVHLTTTYSGCPAADMIRTLIHEQLAALGIANVTLVTQLAPAWSTDWIAPEARSKLRAYGIAPPHLTAARIDVTGISPLRHGAVQVPCPLCGSSRTSLLSQFGSTACKALYRCDACLEPFDYFKPH